LFQQLLTVDLDKVYVGARSSGRFGRLVGRGRRPGRNHESGVELRRNFVANLEAAASDAGPDGCFKGRGFGPEAHPHHFDGVGGDPLLRTAPSGVYSGDGPPAAIDQQQRQAIGRANRHKVAGKVRGQGIGLGPLGPILWAAADQADPVGVDLPDRPEPHALGPEPVEGLGIRSSVSEIPGPARREAVQQPGEVAPGVKAQNTG
jgi:hypothetical protein